MDALSMLPEEWKEFMVSLDEKAFLGASAFRWIHAKRATSYDDMTDMPKKAREKLEKALPIVLPRMVKKQEASDGTKKFLMELADNQAVECVLMKYRFGYSLCISSQVGCRMGCRFCASTLGGLVRNLAAGEMAGQIYQVEREENVRISHVVVMGCGEPFDNYENVLRFFRIINAPTGKNLSLRDITVSTCGLPDKIKAFADSALPVTLAVSLHAPNDSIRRKIMRIAHGVSMDELMEACRYYTDKTNRRITFEYLLIDGVNDSKENALELSGRLSGMLCHVNLIPMNPVSESAFHRSKPKNTEEFQKVLEEHHIPVTRRREMGRDIDAACGQLRRRFEKQAEEVGTDE